MLLLRVKGVIVQRGKQRLCLLWCGNQQCQATNVMQQTSQVSLFCGLVAQARRKFPGDQGHIQAVFPESAQVKGTSLLESVEGLDHRFTDHQHLDQRRAKPAAGLQQRERICICAMVGGAVRHHQHFG